MGGVASFFSPKPKKQKSRSQVASEQIGTEIAARKAKKEEDEKKKIALKLAQLATGAGGILSEATTSRKKLLGN